MSNPFLTSIKNHKGEFCQVQDVESRLTRVRTFTIQECWEAIILPDLQKTVKVAIERRMRKLDPNREFIPF